MMFSSSPRTLSHLSTLYTLCTLYAFSISPSKERGLSFSLSHTTLDMTKRDLSFSLSFTPLRSLPDSLLIRIKLALARDSLSLWCHR